MKRKDRYVTTFTDWGGIIRKRHLPLRGMFWIAPRWGHGFHIGIGEIPKVGITVCLARSAFGSPPSAKVTRIEAASVRTTTSGRLRPLPNPSSTRLPRRTYMKSTDDAHSHQYTSRVLHRWQADPGVFSRAACKALSRLTVRAPITLSANILGPTFCTRRGDMSKPRVKNVAR